MSKKTLLPVLVAVLGISTAMVVANAKPDPEPQEPPVTPPPEVQTISVSPQSLSLQVHSQGTVSPRRKIDLVAEVGGKVVSVAPSYAAGGFFDAGDVLLEIDHRDYEIAVIRARSRVADAEQLLATERGRALQAKREWRDLGSEDANKLFLRKPQLASAEAQLEAAKAELKKAELDLERTTIRAPFNGRLNQIKVDLGQYVTPGTPIANIYAADSVEISLPLTDRQVALLDLPLGFRASTEQTEPLTVTVSSQFAGQQWQWSGSIKRTAASIDEKTRLVYAVAEVENPFGQNGDAQKPPLAIGQFVEVDIPGKAIDNVLVLPANALRPGDKIWTVDSSSRLRIQKVQVLQADADKVAIKSDSDQPIQVVTSYLAQPVAGMTVNSVDASPTAGVSP